MKTSLLVVANGAEREPGGTQILATKLKALSSDDRHIEWLTAEHVESHLSNGRRCLVYLKSEGGTDARLASYLRRWLELGAVVIEHLVFPLAIADRPRADRYIPAFYSRDG